MTATDERVILITGATGNLGSACVRSARGAGATVVALERAEGSLARRFPDLAADPDLIDVPGTDLSDLASVEACLAEVKTRFGRLDAVLNTVGGFAMARLEEDRDDTWSMMQMFNIQTAVNVTRAALPLLRENGGGSIVHVGALAGLKAAASLSAYAASKAAVLRMVEAVSEEVRGDGIRINAVLPSTIDTPENRKAMPDADFSAWVSPAAIADAMLMLAGKDARAVTGALIPVTGRG